MTLLVIIAAVGWTCDDREKIGDPRRCPLIQSAHSDMVQPMSQAAREKEIEKFLTVILLAAALPPVRDAGCADDGSSVADWVAARESDEG